MPLPSQISTIVQEMSLVSERSQSISARLLAQYQSLAANSGSEEKLTEIQVLQKEVNALTEQVRNLQSLLTELPDVEYTDDELKMFRDAFIRSLKGLTLPELISVYPADYFKVQPKNVRVVIATCLVNEFQVRKGTPADLWLSIIAKNGAI